MVLYRMTRPRHFWVIAALGMIDEADVRGDQ
jgi:hypothetical protein